MRASLRSTVYGFLATAGKGDDVFQDNQAEFTAQAAGMAFCVMLTIPEFPSPGDSGAAAVNDCTALTEARSSAPSTHASGRLTTTPDPKPLVSQAHIRRHTHSRD